MVRARLSDECRMPKDGAVCVNRTRDGGRTWETLRAGLPQKDAHDLVYRHGLDVDETGSHLLMGSTTGGLWASFDGGDSVGRRRRAHAAHLCRALRLTPRRASLGRRRKFWRRQADPQPSRVIRSRRARSASLGESSAVSPVLIAPARS